MVACDVSSCAIDQLEVLSKVNVDVFTDRESKDPIEIAKSIKFANENNNNVTIIDTAGRLAIDDQMMQEIEKIKNEVNPNETLFVVDSMTGQDAVNTAKTFNDRLDYDGVVLTKLMAIQIGRSLLDL